MKKFANLTSDQKKTRCILISSILLAFVVSVAFLIDHVQKGNHIDLTLFGAALILGLGAGVGSFIAITIAFMQKDRVL